MICLTRNSASIPGRILLWTLMFALVLAVAVPSDAQASGDEIVYGYVWKLKFNFDSGYDGTLRVEAGVMSGDQLTKRLARIDYPVPCAPVGVVNLVGGVAKFDGGYLKCKLDFGSAIERAFAECADEGCSYDVSDREAHDIITVNTSLQSAGMTTPIVHMPDFKFSATYGPNDITLNSDLGAPIGTASAFFGSLSPSGWKKVGAMYNCAGVPLCSFTFFLSGESDQVIGPGPYSQPAVIHTNAVDLFIGHDGDTGDTVSAGTQIDDLIVDPKNHGD